MAIIRYKTLTAGVTGFNPNSVVIATLWVAFQPTVVGQVLVKNNWLDIYGNPITVSIPVNQNGDGYKSFVLPITISSLPVGDYVIGASIAGKNAIVYNSDNALGTLTSTEPIAGPAIQVIGQFTLVTNESGVGVILLNNFAPDTLVPVKLTASNVLFGQIDLVDPITGIAPWIINLTTDGNGNANYEFTITNNGTIGTGNWLIGCETIANDGSPYVENGYVEPGYVEDPLAVDFVSTLNAENMAMVTIS